MALIDSNNHFDIWIKSPSNLKLPFKLSVYVQRYSQISFRSGGLWSETAF